MKNLIFVALLVSVMLVLTVGGAFAAGDDGYYPVDKNAESGSGSAGAAAGGTTGGSGGELVQSGTIEIARQPDAALSLRNFFAD